MGFARNLGRFKKLYDKKAFLHYYTNTGQMTADFEEAMNETNDLLEEYNDKDSSQTDVDEKEIYQQIMDNLDHTQNFHRFQELRAKHAAKQQRRAPKRKRKIIKNIKRKKKAIKQNEKEYVGP